MRHGLRPEGDHLRLKCEPEHEARTFEQGGRHHAWDGLPSIDIPVVVVAGRVEEDQPSAIAEAVADALPAGRFVLDPTLDHFGPFTHPARRRRPDPVERRRARPTVPDRCDTPVVRWRACSRCRPACRPAGSRSSRRARSRSASPASRSCPSRRPSTPPAARSSTGRWRSPTPTRLRPRDAELLQRSLAEARDEYRRAARLHRARPDRGADRGRSTRSAARSSRTTSGWRTRAHIHPIGLELRLSADVGSLALRGIIDRLELRDGELVVTDYKTGRAPSANWELKSLAGVQLLLLPLRAGARPPPGRHPADVPARAARPSRPPRRSSRPGSSPPAPPPCGRPSSGPASPATSSRTERAVRLVRLPALVPGVRRRPRAGRHRGPGRPDAGPRRHVTR